MGDLRAIVAAATHAPWKYDGEDAGYHTVYAPNAFVVADCADNAEADARYISTFDPDLVSGLIDVVEAVALGEHGTALQQRARAVLEGDM